MNIALWILQVLLALAFLMAGTMKVFQYEKAKARMPWVSGMPKGVVILAGGSEILGAIGLILPALTGVLPWLSPVAAIGLVTVQVLASGLHASRHEYRAIIANVVLLALAAVIAYGRFVAVPL